LPKHPCRGHATARVRVGFQGHGQTEPVPELPNASSVAPALHRHDLTSACKRACTSQRQRKGHQVSPALDYGRRRCGSARLPLTASWKGLPRMRTRAPRPDRIGRNALNAAPVQRHAMCAQSCPKPN
jgi:hypothetical protein